jgi:hypothetical protein
VGAKPTPAWLLQNAVPQSQKRERAIQFLADRSARSQSDFETEGDSDFS